MLQPNREERHLHRRTNHGIDPIEHTRAQAIIPAAPKRHSSPTFEEVAESYMADRLKRLRSEVHRHQWRQTLVDYAYPIIGQMPVDEIETNDVLAVLKPIWETKCETAARLRGRIERILARATVEGHRSGANVAAWRGHLQEALPARSEVQRVKHFRAMEFRDLPAFMVELCQIDTVSAVALRFLILTAARTREVLGVRWTEIDWTEKTWTVPAIRAKTKRDHIVPLSTGALAALREVEPLRGVSDDFIFPGRKGGLSSMTLLALLQHRMKRAACVHGFRSSFRVIHQRARSAGFVPSLDEAHVGERAETHVFPQGRYGGLPWGGLPAQYFPARSRFWKHSARYCARCIPTSQHWQTRYRLGPEGGNFRIQSTTAPFQSV
jgi:integrase